MTMYKSSQEDYVSSKGLHRLGKLRWWFLLLIVIGILAVVALWVFQGGKAVQQFEKSGSLVLPTAIPYAYAQTDPVPKESGFTPQVIIMAGIFVVLGLVYFAGIYKLLFSGTAEQIDAAADLVKTLTGFFVGAATGFLG